MSLLDALLTRVRPRHEQDWVAHEFHTMIACYGRTRQVQPSAPEAPQTAPVPEQPMRFLRDW